MAFKLERLDDIDTAAAAHYASLARKRIAAGAVFRDRTGRALLVRPTYKSTWEVPGGAVEFGEGPASAAAREVEEELGVALPIGPLLVVDWVPAQAPKTEGLLLLFDGGVVTDEVVARFSLAASEVEEWAFVDPVNLTEHVSEGMASRLRAALRALETGRTEYLEEGIDPAARTAS
jgi:ADP-ribose pyrophosphatase YjhB (NUDIX family)